MALVVDARLNALGEADAKGSLLVLHLLPTLLTSLSLKKVDKVRIMLGQIGKISARSSIECRFLFGTIVLKISTSSLDPILADILVHRLRAAKSFLILRDAVRLLELGGICIAMNVSRHCRLWRGSFLCNVL